MSRIHVICDYQTDHGGWRIQNKLLEHFFYLKYSRVMRVWAWTYCTRLSYESVRGQIPMVLRRSPELDVCSTIWKPWIFRKIHFLWISNFLWSSYSVHTVRPNLQEEHAQSRNQPRKKILLELPTGSNNSIRTNAAFASHWWCSAAYKTLMRDIWRLIRHNGESCCWLTFSWYVGWYADFSQRTLQSWLSALPVDVNNSHSLFHNGD